MNTRRIAIKINTLEKTVQKELGELRIELSTWSGQHQQKTSVWQKTAGIMSKKRGKELLKSIEQYRASADKRLKKLNTLRGRKK
ncbi:MAG: hypothetical protein HYV32_00325 [Candidatus Kerfeldbacteria bacterium]|nr:hypothetical protein [Candidatus Kerfeldbacteria bacterium]